MRGSKFVLTFGELLVWELMESQIPLQDICIEVEMEDPLSFSDLHRWSLLVLVSYKNRLGDCRYLLC